MTLSTKRTHDGGKTNSNKKSHKRSKQDSGSQEHRNTMAGADEPGNETAYQVSRIYLCTASSPSLMCV